MLITYYGHSFLKLEGVDFSICLDPFSNIGLNEPNVCADYVFSSHNHFDHNNFSLVQNAKVIDSSFGAFEIIKTYHDNSLGALRGENNVLLFMLDGYKIAFLGDFGEDYNKTLINKLKNVDILFIPIGGKYTIDSKTALNYVLEITPKTVIPIHYKIQGSTIDIEDEKAFLKGFKTYKEVNSPYKYDEFCGALFLKEQRG